MAELVEAEFRVNTVTRYTVTQYTNFDDGAVAVGEVATIENPEQAENVARSMAEAFSVRMSGTPDDPRVKRPPEPSPPSESQSA